MDRILISAYTLSNVFLHIIVAAAAAQLSSLKSEPRAIGTVGGGGGVVVTPACFQHFKDVGQDEYEASQEEKIGRCHCKHIFILGEDYM